MRRRVIIKRGNKIILRKWPKIAMVGFNYFAASGKGFVGVYKIPNAEVPMPMYRTHRMQNTVCDYPATVTLTKKELLIRKVLWAIIWGIESRVPGLLPSSLFCKNR